MKNPQHDFPKMRGGGQRPFGTFPKIHPFWSGDASLSLKCLWLRPKKYELTNMFPWTTFYRSLAFFVRCALLVLATGGRQLPVWLATMLPGFLTGSKER